nr:hypothetical protein [Tanacetum cinerariifolium]
MNYLEEQTDREAMINSIKNGDQPLPHVTQVSIAGTTSTEQPPLKDKSMWSDQEKRNQKIDRLARSLLIQGLLNDIYSLIDSNKTGKDLCDALARHMLGSEYGEQDMKAAVLYEYETFKATEGELLLDTYIRYLQVINDLKKCGYSKDNYVNDAMGSKKKTVVVTFDPLALIAEKTNVSRSKEKVVVYSDSEGSEADDFSELKKITTLLEKAFNRRKFYSKPTNNNLRTSSSSQSANKKQKFVKTDTKKVKKKDEEKKRDMSRVKCYNYKKEGHFNKDYKKAKFKDYEYYKTKMLLAKKDKDEQVLLAEDQAWMESSKASSSSADEKIYEVSYYLSESESESEFETLKYYDNSINFGLFVNNDDDQEIFHDAVESASENFIENHIDSQKDFDKSDIDHNDSEEKEHLVDKLIQKFNRKIAKLNTFEEKNNEFNDQRKVLNKKNADLLAQTKLLKEQLQVKHVVIDTHVECHEKYAKLKAERYEYMIRYSAYFDNDKQHRKQIADQQINFKDDYFQEIINPDFEKIDSSFQQTSSLKPYVSNVILEKIISNLEHEVVNLLEKEKVNLETIESLKSRSFESSEKVCSESENQSENDCLVIEKECDKEENLKISPHPRYEVVIVTIWLIDILTSGSYLDLHRLFIEVMSRGGFRITKSMSADKDEENKARLARFVLAASDDPQEEQEKEAREPQIKNPDFEKIDSPFQQTSSLKPYVPNVILEKIISDLKDEVVNLLEKEKVNLETIESLKSRSFESSEKFCSESENQSENDCLVIEKECDKEENPKVIAPGIFKLNVSHCVSPISMSKSSCDSKNVEIKLKRKILLEDLDIEILLGKKKGSSNTSNVGLSAVSVSNLNKNVKRYSRKDLLACNNSHLGETSSAYMCNDAMNVSCDSRMNDLLDDNNFFIFDDVNVRISPVSKMPFRKKPCDSMNVRSKSNSNKSLPRPVHKWLPKSQPLAEPIAKWFPRIVQICLWIIDSGCSKHITGNRALLTNFVEKFLRKVRFGNNDFAVIAGYGDVASSSQSWLWHQRLSHLNFTTINNLVKNNLVQGLPKMKFKKDHLFSARNGTLVEAARTMLTFANLPSFLWAEAIAIACFTQNRSIIHKRFDKTPYELINKRKPNIKFFRVFGCRCYLLNDYEDAGKLKAKGDIGVLFGYPKESAAFRIYNKRTRKIHESVNVNFDEISEIASKQFSLEPGLSNLNERGKSSNRSVLKVDEASKKDLKDLFQDFYDEYFDSSKVMKSSTTNVETPINEEVFHEVSKSFQGESSLSSLNDDVQHSPKEVILPQTNTQSIPINMVPNGDEATTSHNKWTKDHPLRKIIGDPKSSVRTRGQLANSCLFSCLLSSIEPANVVEALRDVD